jgi:hypothetical protein
MPSIFALRRTIVSFLVFAPPALWAQATEANGPTIRLAKATGEIRVDGDLSDPGWSGVPWIEEWWETNPGNSIPPTVASRAKMTYDGEFLYAAFEYDEPDPKAIRAPLGDRDQLGGQTDYGGVILDARNDGKSAQMFLANASGILYDALTNDSTGEDSSPDFFWEALGRITEKGWQLEMRIPFSSIRYTDPNPEQWGVLLYRNRPRDFRYQYFTSKTPRDRNCFICNVRPVTGLAGLPTGSHWIAAPFVTSSYSEQAVDGAGSELRDNGGEFDGGLDFKWLPNPDTVFDATINPDFSQIETDTAQITTNERFAIFQPERRPFFLESVDLFSTPFQAVYTRTITDMAWGARATGDVKKTKYTLLVGQDDGGGLVILPGSNSSDFALQDFESIVAMGRVKRDFGSSFASFLYSGREIDDGGSNRVLGPDFQWRPNDKTTVTGQLLWSTTETPERPDLADEWDGRELEGHAADLWWNWSDGKWDHYLEGIDVDPEFRAFNGFVTQVGHRTYWWESGRTWRPEKGNFRRVRVSGIGKHSEDEDGETLDKRIISAVGFDALWNSSFRVEAGVEELRAVTRTFERKQLRPSGDIRPGKIFALIHFEGRFGDEIDFSNDRLGDVTSFLVSGEITPTDHLRISPLYSRRTLDVTNEAGLSGRLFTAEVARLKVLYTFNARSWLRLIGQQVTTENDPRLWTFEVERKSSDFGGSLVFAYKLNWQTVLYVGVSEGQQLDERENLEPIDRQAFFKLSYAFRR